MPIQQKNGLTDPDAIVREFQKRQKRVVVAALVCFATAVPLGILAKGKNPFLAAGVILAFLVPLFGYYFWTFRCPACGNRVQQRRRMLREPIRCGHCGVVLDPR